MGQLIHNKNRDSEGPHTPLGSPVPFCQSHEYGGALVLRQLPRGLQGTLYNHTPLNLNKFIIFLMINLKMDALMVSASIMFLSYFTIRCCSIIWIGCCTDHLIDQGPEHLPQTPKPILQPIRVELRCPYPIEVTVVRTPLPEIKTKSSPTYDDPC